MELSILLPVHNEAGILPRSLPSMVGELRATGIPFEIVICENGSTDGTLEYVKTFRDSHPDVQLVQITAGDYGLALRRAVAASRADTVAIFNADFWSVDFLRQALGKLDACDMVVGSKLMKGARDQRPFVRRMITRVFNLVLRVFFKFRGTATGGLKVFKRAPLSSALAQCVTDHFILDTELLLRAQRQGLRICEIPLQVFEHRPHRFLTLAGRVPKAAWDLARLWFALELVSKPPVAALGSNASDEAMRCISTQPFGLRRQAAVSGVASPRRTPGSTPSSSLLGSGGLALATRLTRGFETNS